jgi:hypothetical protein
MKNMFLKIIFVFLGVLMATTAGAEFSMPWINSVSNRVEAMGGAGAAIEDESTELNLLNFGNPAGLVLGLKVNRLDLNGGYFVDNETSHGRETKRNGWEVSNPGGGYHGLTYWLLDNLVLTAEAEGQGWSSSNNQSGSVRDKFNSTGVSGGGRIAYKLDAFAMGADVKYSRLDGKGEPPYLVGNDFAKYEINATHLEWHAGAGYRNKILEKSELIIGASVGVDDLTPDMTVLSSGFTPATACGNYDITVENKNFIEMWGFDPITNMMISTGQLEINVKRHMFIKPLNVAFQIIYNYNDILQSGLLVDYETASKFSENQTIFGNDAPITNSYKDSEWIGVGLTPIVRGSLPICEGGKLIYGAIYSTKGSRTKDNYYLNTSTPEDSNDTYKNTTEKISARNFAIGVGAGFFNGKLNLAFQFDQERTSVQTTFYNFSGSATSDVTDETRQQALRAGLECFLTDAVSINGGYAYLQEVLPQPSAAERQLTNRLSLGAGIKFSPTLSGNILGIMDIYSQEPKPSDDAMHIKLTPMMGIKFIF